MGLYNSTTSYPAPVPTGMPIQRDQQESDEVLFPLSFSESSPIAADGVEIPSQLSVAGSFHYGSHNIGIEEEEMRSNSNSSSTTTDTTEYTSPVSSYSAQQNQYMMANPLLLVNGNTAAYNNYVLSDRDVHDNDNGHYEDVFSLDAPELQHPREEEVAVPPTYSDYTTDHVTLDSLDNVVQQNYRLWLSTV